MQDAVDEATKSLDQTTLSAVEVDQSVEGEQSAEPEEGPLKIEIRNVESAHRTVEVNSEVPGAPFSLVGDARIFNTTCTFGDTGPLCCNCERMKELLLWKGKTIQLYRKGVNFISPPILLVDKDTLQVIWDRDEHGMPAFVEIMKEAKPLESSTSRSAWYSEMACNHCRTRAGLKTHEEIATKKALEAQQRLLDALASKGKKKGKKGGKKKDGAKKKK